MQDRHEHFIQRYAKNRRFIGRTTGISAVINRVLAMSDPVNGEHRKPIHFIVIAGVIAKRSLQCGIARCNMAFQHKFR